MSASSRKDHLTVHETLCDVAIRKARALDDSDADLLASLFTQDSVYDLSGFDFLMPMGILRGRSSIVSSILDAVGHLDTTHMLSNFQTNLSTDDDKSAHLTCYTLAQHFRQHQGQSSTCQQSFLMGNQWSGDLVFDGESWRFKHFGIKCFWTQGDFGAFAGDKSTPVAEDAET